MTMTRLNFTQFALLPLANFADVHVAVVFDFTYIWKLSALAEVNVCPQHLQSLRRQRISKFNRILLFLYSFKGECPGNASAHSLLYYCHVLLPIMNLF